MTTALTKEELLAEAESLSREARAALLVLEERDYGVSGESLQILMYVDAKNKRAAELRELAELS